MTPAAMTITIAGLFLLLGLAAGCAHFQAIAKDAEAIVRGRASPWLALLRIGRMLVTVAVLALAAWQGGWALLTATLGFMAARQVMIVRLGSVR